MQKELLRKIFPHFIAFLCFLVVGAFYFSPAFKGYMPIQGDLRNASGFQRESAFTNDEFGELPAWTGGTFSGMPTVHIAADYKSDYIEYVARGFLKVFPVPMNMWMLYAVGFYILMMALRVNKWLSIVASLAFAFSTYFIIIISVGHINKAWAVAYAAPVLAGLIWTYRGRYLLGAVVTTLAFALEVWSNHVQVTYYFGIIFIGFGIAKLVEAIREKQLTRFAIATGITIGAVVIGVLCSFASIYGSYEYGKATTRGKTELTIKSDGTSNKDIVTSGLDRDYVTQWSYGLGESWTLLIPNAKGGATGPIGNEEKALNKVDPQFRQDVARYNHYWGDQSFTEGPVYVGAGVCLLFVLGLIFVRGSLKWVMLAGVILSLMLSWGKNFMPLTDFFLDNVPGYSKFRAVTIILVVLELCFPVLAFLFVHQLMEKREEWYEKRKKLLYAGGAFIVMLIILWLLPETFFSFISEQEQLSLNEQAKKQPEIGSAIQMFVDNLKDVRIAIFKRDAARSLFFMAATFGLIYAFLVNRIKPTVLIVSLGLLTLIDLIPVNRRYFSAEKEMGRYLQWEPAETNAFPYTPTQFDLEILNRELSGNAVNFIGGQPEQLRPMPSGFNNPAVIVKQIEERVNKRSALKRERGETNFAVEGNELSSIQFSTLGLNTNYRVFNLTVSTFNDASTSYFHKSIGGYHAAKLKRYHELIDFHFSDSINPQVLNMLNAKYIITRQGVQINPNRCGNAWFVAGVQWVNNANEEILALRSFSPKDTAIIDIRFREKIREAPRDSAAIIFQTSYYPTRLTYESNARIDQLAVFSEIYFEGWNAYIDGKPVDHVRANYVLRAMMVPAGKHTIEFRFEPEYLVVGERFGYIGSALLGVLLLGSAVVGFMNRKKKETAQSS